MNIDHTMKARGLHLALGTALLAGLAACGGGGSDALTPAKPTANLAADRKADTTQWTIAPIGAVPPAAGISAVAATYLNGFTSENPVAGTDTNSRLWVFDNGVPALGLTAGATLRWRWHEGVSVNIPATATLPADPLHTREISNARTTSPSTPEFVICNHKPTANFTGTTQRCSVPGGNPATVSAPGGGGEGFSVAQITNGLDSASPRFQWSVGVFDPNTCSFKVGPVPLGKINFADIDDGWIGYVSTVPGRAQPMMNNFPSDQPLAKGKTASLTNKVCQLEVDTRGLKADLTPELRDVVLNLDGAKSRAIKAMVAVDGDGNVLVNQAPLVLPTPVKLVPRT